MTKTLMLATGALLLASTAPAFAQDAAPPAAAAPMATPAPADPTMAPAPTPDTGAAPTSTMTSDDLPTFAGPRAEIFGGFDRAGARFRTSDAGGASTLKGHKDGAIAGALVGFDAPLGDRLVAGVFGSYALPTVKQCGDIGGYDGCVKAGREIEGGARIGAKAMGGRTLVYLKGAYVNDQLRGNFSDGVTTESGHSNRDGWRAGAGAELALNRHAYVKVEYDYTRLKSYRADLGATDASLRFDRNQVLGGFGVRF